MSGYNNVSGITAANNWLNAPAPPNLLDMATKAQNLTNAQTSNQLTQQQIQNAQLENQQGQVKLGNDSQTAIARTLISLKAIPPGQLTQAQINQAIDDTASAGHLSPTMVSNFKRTVAAVPTDQNGVAVQPGGFSSILDRALLYTANPELVSRLTQPTIGAQMTPGGVVGTQQAPQMGGTSPPGAMTTVGSPVVQGIPAQVHTATDAQGGTYPVVIGGGNTPAKAPPPITGMPSGPNYAVPPQQRPQAAPGEVTSPSGMPYGTLSPIQQSALAQGQKDYTTDTANLNGPSGLKAQESTILSAQGALNAPGVNTGPGSSFFNTLRNAVSTYHNAVSANPSDLDAAAAAQDKFKKDTARLFANDPNAAKSVAALVAAEHGNMSEIMNKQTNKDLGVTLLGLNRQQQLAQAAAQADGSDYTKTRQFASGTDPMGLAYNSMSDAQRKTYEATLGSKNSPAYKNYVRSVVIANRYHLLDAGPQGNQ